MLDVENDEWESSMAWAFAVGMSPIVMPPGGVRKPGTGVLEQLPYPERIFLFDFTFSRAHAGANGFCARWAQVFLLAF